MNVCDISVCMYVCMYVLPMNVFIYVCIVCVCVCVCVCVDMCVCSSVCVCVWIYKVIHFASVFCLLLYSYNRVYGESWMRRCVKAQRIRLTACLNTMQCSTIQITNYAFNLPVAWKTFQTVEVSGGCPFFFLFSRYSSIFCMASSYVVTSSTPALTSEGILTTPSRSSLDFTTRPKHTLKSVVLMMFSSVINK